jgi:xanthine dehydrogenase YagS FAD-binding subunit
LRDFEHYDATSIDQAVALLAQHGEAARVIAGGQDILFRMKKYIVTPTVLVNLKTIPGLNQIRHEKNVGLRIGPLATLSQIAASADVRAHYNALAQAVQVVASPQIRNFGTIGGNLCQDVWCWYLQDGFSCWKSGGRFCDLAAGDSSIYGSVMGGHLCLANHPSDLAPALVALDASIHIASPQGARRVSAADFFPGHIWVGSRLQCHILQHDEIISEIELPFRPARSTYIKFAYRKSWDFAVASVAAVADEKPAQSDGLRLVFGGVATHPFRSFGAENFLRGKKIDETSAGQASEVALADARPLKMNQYKVDLAKTLAKRALLAVGNQ